MKNLLSASILVMAMSSLLVGLQLDGALVKFSVYITAIVITTVGLNIFEK